jgi:hypothetical protein
MLLIPAATAYGLEPGEQEVTVRVLPPDTLAVNIDQWVDFGPMAQGELRHYDFGLNVLNTTSGGFAISVSGGDLQSFEWEGCDESGCWNPLPTDPLYTIPSTSLVVNGGDLDWWDEQAGYDVVVPASVPVTTTPDLIVSATQYAHGEFMFDNPWGSIDLTVPSDAQPMHQYRTVLTYTIAGTPPV